MDFDFSQVSVPFRMQPGLRRLARSTPQLTPLKPGTVLHGEKRQVLAAGLSRHAVPGFDAAPALDAIEHKAREQGIEGRLAGGAALELAFEEDLAVLDGESTTLPWLRVCVPSRWAPEEKLGLPFAAVHAPVADNTALQAAGAQLVRLVTAGDCWERFVWTVTPSGRYDQHPLRHSPEPWPQTSEPQDFAAQCFLRGERQTFFPVARGTRQAVFTIRVMLQPLTQAVAVPESAQRLHDSLASMCDAVLAYKGLAAARAPLLRWLGGRAS